MRLKRIAGLTVCAMVLILAAGCGKIVNRTEETALSYQNAVQSVPEQEISEAGTEVEKETETEKETEIEKEAEIASECVDLTVLSGTMVYAEVYNMMCHPENFVGKTVKMSGSYAVYHDESTGKYYHSCIISDATACCSQGIEFELAEDYTYPDDYPEEGGQICVEGVFDTYKEGEYTFCTLRNSRIQD